MKPIKIPDTLKQSLLNDFEKFLTTERMSNGTIHYTTSITDILKESEIQKPTINFTATAYLKMQALVEYTSSEIGWHGTVLKNDNIYTILDVFMYPQKVTGTTVTGDDDLYPKWLMSLPDTTFNLLRFQGHSHVNMTSSPSGVDTNFYDAILQTLNEGDYYIFCILNKRNDLNIWIYDFEKNIIFEKKDIVINILTKDNAPITDWLKTEKEKYLIEPVKTEVHRGYHFENTDYYKSLEQYYGLRPGYYDSTDQFDRYPYNTIKGGKKKNGFK